MTLVTMMQKEGQKASLNKTIAALLPLTMCISQLEQENSKLLLVHMSPASVAFVPEMPEEFLQEDDVHAFGAMTREHWEAWRHIESWSRRVQMSLRPDWIVIRD
ncbi:hypothetical protein EDB83DRAFT_2320212 [Lactarius deliciosus]|nr:hypothetical protein EDB83DRAFT_2320212 [Lactarius deliciosus]